MSDKRRMGMDVCKRCGAVQEFGTAAKGWVTVFDPKRGTYVLCAICGDNVAADIERDGKAIQAKREEVEKKKGELIKKGMIRA